MNNKIFEAYVRNTYGDRYNLSRDVEGFYASEIVKRMFDVWCYCNK